MPRRCCRPRSGTAARAARLDRARAARRARCRRRHGAGGRALKRRYPKARVIAVDSSAGMLRGAARRRGVVSAVRPPLRGCDAAAACRRERRSRVQQSALPWCDPDAVFAELRRVLAPRGLLTLTGLGPDTLRELRAAWAGVDGHVRVGEFIDMHDVGDALVRAGFAAPVLDVERYTLRYADVRALAADLKATGARNARRRAAQGPHFAAQIRGHARRLRSAPPGRAPPRNLRSRLRASLGASRGSPARAIGAERLARVVARAACRAARKLSLAISPESARDGSVAPGHLSYPSAPWKSASSSRRIVRSRPRPRADFSSVRACFLWLLP